MNEDHAFVGLNPEIGHVLMVYEDLAYVYSWPLSEGRLAHPQQYVLKGIVLILAVYADVYLKRNR
jgi:hypothetical protein